MLSSAYTTGVVTLPDDLMRALKFLLSSDEFESELRAFLFSKLGGPNTPSLSRFDMTATIPVKLIWVTESGQRIESDTKPPDAVGLVPNGAILSKEQFPLLFKSLEQESQKPFLISKRTEKLTDEKIKELFDGIDFKSMVTADDLFFLIVRQTEAHYFG